MLGSGAMSPSTGVVTSSWRLELQCRLNQLLFLFRLGMQEQHIPPGDSAESGKAVS
jgi:hypothetical protein